MKKYLLGIFAIVLAIGFSAFTPKAHKAKAGLTTYFAVKTGTGTWRWDTSVPQGFTCQSETVAAICTADAASQPANNTIPSGYTADNTFYEE
jgi:hypothetical protein